MNNTNRKTALVTGASRGIGTGIAYALAKRGYDIAITYSTHYDEAEAVSKIIREEYGRECVVFQASMENPEVPQQIVRKTIDHFKNLDVLVNNAGVTIFESIQDLTIATLDKLYSLDFRAYLLTIHEAAAYMIKEKIRGSIINITSSRAERAYPCDAVYGGMKAALERASKSIALDLAPYGIRVNCVAPGATIVRDMNDFYRNLAPRIPLERVGTPEDVGNAVAWLASEEASYVTGITIRVDGGLILPGMPEVLNEDIMVKGWGHASFRKKKDS